MNDEGLLPPEGQAAIAAELLTQLHVANGALRKASGLASGLDYRAFGFTRRQELVRHLEATQQMAEQGIDAVNDDDMAKALIAYRQVAPVVKRIYGLAAKALGFHLGN